MEDVPELIHLIQSLLGVRQAARTCLLSKSWLYAWSTIPNLRFSQSRVMDEEYVDHTIQRYLKNSILIEKYCHDLDIKDQEFAFLAENWIRSIASKNSCLKVLNLTIFVANINSFLIPDEIFSCEHLNSVTVTVPIREIGYDRVSSKPVMMSSNYVINCVSLRVLELDSVHISEDVVDRILSTCTLLEKVKLEFCKGLKTFKVKNLRYLRMLTIESNEEDNTLEIDDVPSLHLFHYHSLMKLLPSNTVSLGSAITELRLSGVIIDDALLDMINSKLPLLLTLNLTTWEWSPERLNIESASLKRLILKMWEDKQIDIQVYAPKLLYFSYDGIFMPSFVFPANTPRQIKLKLSLRNLFGHSFYAKCIEALKLSSKFDVKIIDKDILDHRVPLNIDKIDLDDLRRRVPVPAANVRKLSIKIVFQFPEMFLWEHSPILEAIFCICHPNLIKAYHRSLVNTNYFGQLMLNVMDEKKTSGLKDVEIKNPLNGKWETITDSRINFVDISNDSDSVEFKLNWCSL